MCYPYLSIEWSKNRITIGNIMHITVSPSSEIMTPFRCFLAKIDAGIKINGESRNICMSADKYQVCVTHYKINRFQKIDVN